MPHLPVVSWTLRRNASSWKRRRVKNRTAPCAAAEIYQKQREMQEHHMVVHDFEAFKRNLAVF
jgi:hypothetical protein